MNPVKEWRDHLIQTPGEVLLARKVGNEGEVKMGLETLTTMAAPSWTRTSCAADPDFQGGFSIICCQPREDDTHGTFHSPQGWMTNSSMFLPCPTTAGRKMQQEVEEILKLGVIEPSNSGWCSPVEIVFKKDRSLPLNMH